jgi:hypothetical protein
MLLGAASLYIALPGLAPMLEGAAHAGINRMRRLSLRTLDPSKLSSAPERER